VSGDVDLVQYRCDAGVAEIVLNRPAVLNALSDQAVAELRAAVIRLDEDDDAKVAILHGQGRAFCSGADVRQRHLRPLEELRRLGGPQARGTKVSDVFFDLTSWKPVITAAHGYALGAGLHLALLSDVIVAEADTKFQITEIPRGLDGGAFWRLLNRAGSGAFADEVTLTGRMWTAEEGWRAGVVTRLASAGGRLQAAREIANQILANPPLAVREAVRLRRLELQRIELAHAITGSRHLHLTEDFRESARAFAEGRPPAPFLGR
jgi:enoyl-CoA hydratase/carnithine racemase